MVFGLVDVAPAAKTGTNGCVRCLDWICGGRTKISERTVWSLIQERVCVICNLLPNRSTTWRTCVNKVLEVKEGSTYNIIYFMHIFFKKDHKNKKWIFFKRTRVTSGLHEHKESRRCHMNYEPYLITWEIRHCFGARVLPLLNHHPPEKNQQTVGWQNPENDEKWDGVRGRDKTHNNNNNKENIKLKK